MGPRRAKARLRPRYPAGRGRCRSIRGPTLPPAAPLSAAPQRPGPATKRYAEAPTRPHETSVGEGYGSLFLSTKT
jgi:hypothetical protein